jgi:hypothetical protein
LIKGLVLAVVVGRSWWLYINCYAYNIDLLLLLLAYYYTLVKHKQLRFVLHSFNGTTGCTYSFLFPALQVGLASGLGQYTEVVREAQKGIKLRNVRFVDAKGLSLQDGHLHLSTQAQVQLGHMLAQSYLNYGTTSRL